MSAKCPLAVCFQAFLSVLYIYNGQRNEENLLSLLSCTSGGSGVGRSDEELHKNVKGDVKWLKGTQINRPDEAMIKKWLDEVL